MSKGRLILHILPLLVLTASTGQSQVAPPRHVVVPLTAGTAGIGIERVWGDPDKPGVPYVIRIRDDRGFVILPHTHPEDENLTVLKGTWALGMGTNVNLSALEPLEVGSFGFVPKKMAHFAQAKTATVVQIHGIGPFSLTLIDPAYWLNEIGTFRETSTLQPPSQVPLAPPGCFALALGTRVRADYGDGKVVRGHCSPANKLTQYMIEKKNGERFWALSKDLTKF